MKQLVFLFVAVFHLHLIGRAQSVQEFRGVWIATVDNIDWPGKGNYNADSQKREFIRLLNMHQQNGLNAVIVQVRPATDALYPSRFEPWSQWLNGIQGKPPYPYYDPLQFMIEETHKRKMEFHAWCNPYRAIFKNDSTPLAPNHLTRLFPDWFVRYGNKTYFDPGIREAQDYLVRVIKDIVQRYEVDAIHFDDYFYPYRIPGIDFPDSASYARFGNNMKKDDWRRSNVDSIIRRLNVAIKSVRSSVKFGISPFGVWRSKDRDPEGSNTIGASTNYDDLYANILLWLQKGWIDYVAPQLYWEIGHKVAPFEELLTWWSQHTYGKHCYIGIGVYRANSNTAWKDSSQLPRQIRAIRQNPRIKGMIFFSSKSLLANPNGWADSLRNNYFNTPARVPDIEWVR